MHPIAYSARFEGEDRNRLTVFFRWLVILPWGIVAALYGIGAFFATVVAWFALVVTGDYPRGLYDFNAGFLRFCSRFNGFAYLLTDEWPSFGGGEDPDYPVRTLVGGPKAEYSRAKALFRIILFIPVGILSYIHSTIISVVALIAWFVVLLTGELPLGLYKPLRISSAYMVKALGYHLLLTEDFPPFWQDEHDEAPRFGGSESSLTLTGEPTGPVGL